MLGDEFIEINRKMGYEELHKSNADDILAENQPTKFVLEVTKGRTITKKYNRQNVSVHFLIRIFYFPDGHIRIWSELDKSKPLATAFDENPLDVKFVSFAIYEPAHMEFFYNCQDL